jgi:hypothetical protein
MPARHSKDDHADPGRAVAALTWLGGAAAWMVAAGAATSAAGWPLAVALSVALVFAVVVLAAIRSTVSTSRGTLVRIAVAVVLGLLVGELSAMLVFGSAVTERLQQQAAAHAATVPAVASATADLDAERATRKGLDDAVDSARRRRDGAQVVARCEYQPAPSCPQHDITGVAGDGQITRNSQDVLDQNQHELDAALGTREQQAPALDNRIAEAEHATAQARQASITGADRGFGTRWVAMNAYTLSTPSALVLRVLLTACCILLYLLPLLLHTRADRTLRERHNQSRLRAELEAETAITVKRAQARAAAEVLQAEHQLANIRMALEAETAINREHHRQRVADALAAEPAELPARVTQIAAASAPEPIEAAAVVKPAATPLLPDLAGAAVRFLRPLVPPVITQVVENSTQQLRSAQKVFEEFEEFTFSFRRTTRVTVQDSEQHLGGDAIPTVIDQSELTGPSNALDSSDDPRQLQAGRRAIER